MMPFNVLNGDKFYFPIKHSDLNIVKYEVNSFEKIQLKVNSETVVKRAILNIVTVKNLRAAYIFRFQKGKMDWNLYEPKSGPISEKEHRGAIISAIKQMRTGPSPTLKRILTEKHSYIDNTKSIISALEQLQENSEVFVILIFKNVIFICGNYYDETAMIQAMLNFVPNKKSVTRNIKYSHYSNINRLQRLKQDPDLPFKKVDLESFSYMKKVL